MNKLNLHPPTLTRPSDIESDASIRWFNLETSRRLVVLIPADSNFTAVTRRIWELAIATASTVKLLGLCKDASQEPSLRRGLVTMSALIQDAKVSVEIDVEIGTDWVKALSQNLQSVDMIVCMSEQRAGIWRRPLNQILESKLNNPVYILSGASHRNRAQSAWLSQTLGWCGSLAILAAAFLLQLRIAELPADWFQSILFISSMLVEVWLIWVWNNLCR